MSIPVGNAGSCLVLSLRATHYGGLNRDRNLCPDVKCQVGFELICSRMVSLIALRLAYPVDFSRESLLAIFWFLVLVIVLAHAKA